MTYDSKFIIWLLENIPKVKDLSYFIIKATRAIFGSSGSGNQIVIKEGQREKKAKSTKQKRIGRAHGTRYRFAR